MATISGKWILQFPIPWEAAEAFSEPVNVQYTYTSSATTMNCIQYVYYSSTACYELCGDSLIGDLFAYGYKEGNSLNIPATEGLGRNSDCCWLDFGNDQVISENDFNKIKAIAHPVKSKWYIKSKVEYSDDVRLSGIYHLGFSGARLYPTTAESSDFISLKSMDGNSSGDANAEYQAAYADGAQYINNICMDTAWSGVLCLAPQEGVIYNGTIESNYRILDLTNETTDLSESFVKTLAYIAVPAESKAYTNQFVKQLAVITKKTFGLTAKCSLPELVTLSEQKSPTINLTLNFMNSCGALIYSIPQFKIYYVGAADSDKPYLYETKTASTGLGTNHGAMTTINVQAQPGSVVVIERQYGVTSGANTGSISTTEVTGCSNLNRVNTTNMSLAAFYIHADATAAEIETYLG